MNYNITMMNPIIVKVLLNKKTKGGLCMKQLIVNIFIVLFSYSAFGAISNATIEGKVLKYNKNQVLIVQDNGKKIKVSRSSIPTQYKLKRGLKISVPVDSKKLMTLLKKSSASQKKATKKEIKTKRVK